MLSIGLSLTGQLRSSVTAFSPVSLFAASEPGIWYDPSDLTTMFTDTAGTTPVTTPGQIVALLLDKSKGLVLGPELVTNGDFATNSNWSLTNATINGGLLNCNSVISVNLAVQNISLVTGKTYKVIFTVSNYVSGTGTAVFGVGSNVPVSAFTANGTYTVLAVAGTANSELRIGCTGSGLTCSIDNISVKELTGNHATQATTASRPTYGIVPLGGRRNLLLATDTMATQSLTVAAVAHTLSFTGTGTVTLTGASIAGPLIGTGASNRVSLTFTPTAASLTLTVVGSVTLAQLELGSTATAYQRVTTQYDVTESGVQSLSYLSFDGVDDFLVTPTITPGIDKAQVFAGVRKPSDAAARIVLESGASIAANNGVYLAAPNGSASTDRYSFFSRGSAPLTGNHGSNVSGVGAAPENAVITGIGDIPGDSSIIRRNGVAYAAGTSDQGTGNYSAQPLYIGARGGTVAPFNGQIYSLIVRFGTNLDAGTITSTETFVNGKTGAY